jgi:hypothetical protein
MKKIILFGISLAFLPGILPAQQTNPDHTKDSKEKKQAAIGGAIVPFMKLDQRKIYHWANGQRSTPTGRQAGDPFANYAEVFGDSAVVVSGPVVRK